MRWQIVGLTFVSSATIIGVSVGPQGLTDSALVAALRGTAFLSLGLFLAAFVASSVNRLWPGSIGKWLLRERRYIGVSFALSHFIHLGLIAMRAALHPAIFFEQKPPLQMIPGATAYAFIAAMAITSFTGPARALGRRRWLGLHKIGVYVIWVLFVMAFASRMRGTPLDALALPVLLGALGLRIAARREAKSNA